LLTDPIKTVNTVAGGIAYKGGWESNPTARPCRTNGKNSGGKWALGKEMGQKGTLERGVRRRKEQQQLRKGK